MAGVYEWVQFNYHFFFFYPNKNLGFANVTWDIGLDLIELKETAGPWPRYAPF